MLSSDYKTRSEEIKDQEISRKHLRSQYLDRFNSEETRMMSIHKFLLWKPIEVN